MQLPFDKEFYDKYKVYIKPQEYPMSTRKIESLLKIAHVQKFYQCNPVRFIHDAFNIDLLDSQAYAITRMWNTKNVLICASRGFGKSTIIDLFLMSKDMLNTSHWAYIASGSGSQAQDTFRTLEKLANNQIDSFSGSTGEVFKSELEVHQSNSDGFVHSADGWNYTLYGGSSVRTLNSNVDRRRGKLFFLFKITYNNKSSTRKLYE